jgi:hypothetical protein
MVFSEKNKLSFILIVLYVVLFKESERILPDNHVSNFPDLRI